MNGVKKKKRMQSLPTRERGLKHSKGWDLQNDLRSLPTRERGLKRERGIFVDVWIKVAPHAGAWIETEKPT